MTRQVTKFGLAAPCPAGREFEAAIDDSGLEEAWPDDTTENRTQDWPLGDARCLDPGPNMPPAACGDLTPAAIAEGVVLGATHQNTCRPIGQHDQVFRQQADQLRTAAEGVVTQGEHCSIAQADEVIAAGCNQVIPDRGRQTQSLMRPTSLGPKGAPEREADLLIRDCAGLADQSVDLADAA